MLTNKFISIDTETTGLDDERCQILEFAAVLDDLTKPIEERKAFHCIVNLEEIIGQPYALAMNHEILKIIADGPRKHPELMFLTPDKIASAFWGWVETVYADEPGFKSFSPAGKNFAGFDWQFTKRLPGWKRMVRQRHRYIDPAPLYWNPDIDGTILPDSDTCCQRAGLEKMTVHRALPDAYDTCDMIRRWHEKRKSA